MEWILDGYNAIHAIPRFEKLLRSSLREAREALERSCSRLLQERGDVNRLTIVYDGRGNFFSDEFSCAEGVSVVFTTQGETADEFIIEKILHARPRSPITVISSDNQIINHVRACGFKAMTVRELIPWLERTSSPKADPQDEPGLTGDQKCDITAHYKRQLGL